MEIFFIFYLFLIFIASSAIATISYRRFYKYPMQQLIAYTFLLLIGSTFFSVKYWKMNQMHSEAIPFVQNHLSFTYMPKYSGRYSVDLIFLNKQISQIYKTCEFSWITGEKKNDTQCKKALIYRKIYGTINNQNFLLHFKYIDGAFLAYGDNNNAIAEPSLRIFEYNGKKNVSANFKINIDASTSELQHTQAAVIVGAESEDAGDLFFLFFQFILISIPFDFAILIIISKKLKNKFKH